jgi:hypothetical protein
MTPNTNPENSLEAYAAQHWIELNQLHAEYAKAIRLIRLHQYDGSIITACVKLFTSPGERWELTSLRLKRALLLLNYEPVRAAIRTGGGQASYNRFCDLLARKFNGWRHGTPNERFFVDTNRTLVESVLAMYQAEVF